MGIRRRDGMKRGMNMDEQAIAAGLKRLRINKQLSAVKVPFGPLGFGEDLSCISSWKCSRAEDPFDKALS